MDYLFGMENTESKGLSMNKKPVCVLLAMMLLLSFAPIDVLAAELPEAEVEISHFATAATTSYERSWYGASLALSRTSYTPTHYYDGNNVGIEMSCSSEKEGSFTVTLWRSVTGNSERVGTAMFDRNGFTKATWSNVGPGSYYFIFTKASDGALVYCRDIGMYSW